MRSNKFSGKGKENMRMLRKVFFLLFSFLKNLDIKNYKKEVKYKKDMVSYFSFSFIFKEFRY